MRATIFALSCVPLFSRCPLEPGNRVQFWTPQIHPSSEASLPTRTSPMTPIREDDGTQLAERFERAALNDEVDEKLGFGRIQEGMRREGWLVNMHPVSDLWFGRIK